jgi:hypothetical protein
MMIARLIGIIGSTHGEVQRQTTEEDDQEDRDRSASLEQALFLDAALGVVDEIEERAAAQVAAGRREHLEVGELRDRIGATRGRGLHVGRDGARLCHRCRPFTVAERDLAEDVGMLPRARRARGHLDRPLRLRRRRRITDVRVARLIPELDRHGDVAG